MEDLGNQAEELLDRAVEYGKTTVELAKLKAVDRLADVTSSLSIRIIGGAVLLLFILFASLALALWLGEVFGKVYFGFLAVGAFYGLLAIVVPLIFKNQIRRVISDFIIKRILN